MSNWIYWLFHIKHHCNSTFASVRKKNTRPRSVHLIKYTIVYFEYLKIPFHQVTFVYRAGLRGLGPKHFGGSNHDFARLYAKYLRGPLYLACIHNVMEEQQTRKISKASRLEVRNRPKSILVLNYWINNISRHVKPQKKWEAKKKEYQNVHGIFPTSDFLNYIN